MIVLIWRYDLVTFAISTKISCSFLFMILGLYTAGQNIAASSPATNWTDQIDAWHSEVNHFQFGSGSTNTSDVGHYTQVLASRFFFLFMLVASYSPALKK